MAMHLGLPSPACKPILGQPVGHQGAVVGPFVDELNYAHLTSKLKFISAVVSRCPLGSKLKAVVVRTKIQQGFLLEAPGETGQWTLSTMVRGRGRKDNW